MYRLKCVVLVVALCGSSLGYAHNGDEMVDPKTTTKTLAPKVVVDSGQLHWVPHARDLSRWPTLCNDDSRSIPKAQVAHYVPPLRGDAVRGRVIAMDPWRGNCVTCHEIPGEEWPGSFGIPLIHHKQRRHTDAELYQQIFDVRITSPRTTMPPFGPLGILSDQEIRDLVAYLQSLE